MSAATITIAVGERHATPQRQWTSFGSRLRARFYRFLEKLPERHDDIDLEVFKRVSAPI
jgi:hypothetical protein